MSANDKQIGGDHYHKLKVQPWDFMASCFTYDEFCGFLKGNALKYISRDKNDNLEDVCKAIHYLEKLKEVMMENA